MFTFIAAKHVAEVPRLSQLMPAIWFRVAPPSVLHMPADWDSIMATKAVKPAVDLLLDEFSIATSLDG